MISTDDSETTTSNSATDPSFEGAEQAPCSIPPRRVVEAVLFAADAPLPPAKIASIVGVGDARDVRKYVAELNAEYEQAGLAFRINEIAGGYRFLTLPIYNTWLTKLMQSRDDTRLSPAALETLAIVAYKQPCTRADVEAIRGVAAGDLLNRLRENNLIKIAGRAEDLGRPMLYGTTKHFLEVFGLASLDDLPQVEALQSGSRAKAPALPGEGLKLVEPEDAEASSEESEES
jgi:segregation and condensation protein B